MNQDGHLVDQKSNQWFGATVSSSGINGPLVVCIQVFYVHDPMFMAAL